MTLPTITHGVGAQDDCGDADDYSETEDGMSATLTVLSGTVFNIEVSQAVGNKKVYYELDLTNIAASSYPKGIFKYKTSNDSIKAQVQIVFSDATTEFVCGLISSTSWTTESWTVTEGNQSKTIDKIRLYACESTGNVYYDFWSIHDDVFEFPKYDFLNVDPKGKIAVLPIFGADTDVTQHGGRGNTVITIRGPMRAGQTWGGSKLTYGQYFMRIMYERKFQWLTLDQGIAFKVMCDIDRSHIFQDKTKGDQWQYEMVFTEYDEGDASIFEESWYKA